VNQASRQVVLRPNRQISGVKVFTATMRDQRANLGEIVTEWIAAHRGIEIIDITVTQSSDASFHCLAITVTYCEPASRR
jgi:hypothetical protein